MADTNSVRLPSYPSCGLRTFGILVGRKPGPGRNHKWLASEILEIGEAA